MSPNMVGALFGFLIGLSGFFFMRLAASRVESRGVTRQPEFTARILRYAALFDLVLFTVLGWFLGPMLLQQAG